MSVNFLYSTGVGKAILKVLLHSDALKLAEKFVRSPLSKVLVKPYIKKNHINMKEFRNQEFGSFAEFFSRKKERTHFDNHPDHLISPCDSMLSIYLMEDGIKLPIKNSLYEISDLIPDKEVAEQFADGACFIFRLRASDYHHFCYVDDCYHKEAHFIPGLLHSVQPIACEKEQVYKINRRQWSLMETSHFGTVAQIEVGALLVGGMKHVSNNKYVKKGDEMGYFELAGSTIVLLFTKETKEALGICSKYQEAVNGVKEVEVKQGQVIGVIGK